MIIITSSGLVNDSLGLNVTYVNRVSRIVTMDICLSSVSFRFKV